MFGGNFPQFNQNPGIPTPLFNQNMNVQPDINREQDLDELIKSIDRQIAELEAEEKREQEKLKNEEPVIKEEPPVMAENVEVIETPKDEVSEPINFETKEVVMEGENAPKVSEIVHSNMVNLENFKLKEEEDEPIEETKPEDNDDYDDFFDDFFDE